MSGRRRRDDDWDSGQPEAKDSRRDPWADSSVDDWGSGAGGASWDGAPGNGADQGRGSSPAAPTFSSFPPGAGGRDRGAAGRPGDYETPDRGDDRYGAGSAQPGRHGGSGSDRNGYGSNGYDNGAAPGYGDSRREADRGPGRREAAGRDAGYDGAYNGNGQGGSANGYNGADGNGYNGAGGSFGVNRGDSPVQIPEFTPADSDDADDDASGATPRPIGRLSIYTLHEDKTREFDRLAERAAEGVRTAEPDTLVYVIHIVPKAPLQRIMYEIYRDRAAFLSHERQPHIRQFSADRASCVLATNVIDLRLKYAKVAALSSASSPQQPSWGPRAADSAPAADRGAAATPQYQPTAQYQPSAQFRESQPAAEPQYQPTQYSSGKTEPAAATFTPARDRSADGSRQHAATGREHYPSSAAQYENNSGAYGASNGNSYGAGSNDRSYGSDSQNGGGSGYSGSARYANGGSYSSANGYPGSGGYSGGNGYQGGDGYQPSNGYSNGNGYQPNGGYPNGGGYSGSSRPNGSGGAYPGGDSTSDGSSYGAENGSGYGPSGGYPGGSESSHGAQYTPRFRELTSGPNDGGSRRDPDDRRGSDSRRGDDLRGEETRPPFRPSEWEQRSQDRR